MRAIALSVAMLLTLCAASGAAPAADPASSSAASRTASAIPSRYTFSWPLNGVNPTPRGGTSKGPPVQLDTAASASWRALQAPGLTPFERDRRAILAIAGEYRANFDFLEIASYAPGVPRARPYQSWGTERIYVDQDRGTFISLLHILEMRIIQPDGSISPPMVQKHWREDWQYEPKQLIEFKGNGTWQRRTLSASERRGEWSQTVAQVDESPRYASLGRWEHTADFSTWISRDTWRPLPRRESPRKDYQVLYGTNRVTVVPTGWLQEENNLKALLPPHSATLGHYLSREYGVARYERLKDADFAAATVYFDRTKAFWDHVHEAYLGLFRDRQIVALHAPKDRENGPHAQLFDYADQLAAGKAPPTNESELIQAALRDVGAPVQAAVAKPSGAAVVAVARPQP